MNEKALHQFKYLLINKILDVLVLLTSEFEDEIPQNLIIEEFYNSLQEIINQRDEIIKDLSKIIEKEVKHGS